MWTPTSLMCVMVLCLGRAELSCLAPKQIDNMPADAEGPTPVILHLNSMSGADVYAGTHKLYALA